LNEANRLFRFASANIGQKKLLCKKFVKKIEKTLKNFSFYPIWRPFSEVSSHQIAIKVHSPQVVNPTDNWALPAQRHK
jgi:hypothetical protein